MKKILLIGILVFLPQFAFAGSQTYSTPGTYTFTVPAYGALAVDLRAGGGGGGSGVALYVHTWSPGNAGANGGNTTFSTAVASGGTGGPGGRLMGYVGSGSPGGGSGGTVYVGGGASGGSGGACSNPGYGCVGIYRGSHGGAGGNGGRTVYTFAAGALPPGSAIIVQVGNGGARGQSSGAFSNVGSAGSDGAAYITWTDPPPALACTGSPETFSTPGTYTRTVPSFSTMTVEVWGGGGAGGGFSGVNGTTGGAGSASSFNNELVANGGGGGVQYNIPGAGGTTNNAGDVNTSGNSGQNGSTQNGVTSVFVPGGDGGSAPNGGAGGTGARSSNGNYTGSPGSIPGAGGGGGSATVRRNPFPPFYLNAGSSGGGSGGYTSKTYTQSTIASGAQVSIVVGPGGTGSGSGTSQGGSGAPGGVVITCSQNSPPSDPALTTSPASPIAGTLYTYGFTSYDEDVGDTLRYAVDWDNDGVVNEYIPANVPPHLPSGTEGQTIHSTSTSGTMTFKAQAIDNKGNASGWATFTKTVSTPAPTVLLTATPDSIGSGESSTLEWSSENATSCTGTNFATGNATSGIVIVSPTQTTTYTVTCNGAGGEASDSAEVIYTCTPVNQCSGQNVVNSCTGAVVQSCAYQCGAGACIPPPAPSFNSSGSGATALTGHLQIRPSLVKTNDRTRVFWNVSDVTSCTATGDNTPADSWTVAGTLANNWTSTSGSTGVQSSQITQRTTYTLSCTPFTGQSFTPESASANVAPVFRER